MAKKKKSVRTSARKPANRIKKDRWDIKRIFLPLGFAALALLAGSQLTYTRNFQSNVLGDEDSSSGRQETEAAKQQEEQRQEAAKQQQEQIKESSQNSGSSGTISQRNETETETRDGVKIKTKTEDNGAVKVEAESEDVHFNFQEENGEVKLHVETEDGKEITAREHLKERDELEQELEDEDINISSEAGEMEIEHNDVRARFGFPLSIDPVTRDLIVTTPAGERTVAVLPDEAMRRLFASGKLTPVASGSAQPQDASSSGTLANSIELTLKNGNLVYEVNGEKHEKFLGVVPVTFNRKITVSALSGEVLSEAQSILDTILGFLSF